MSRSLGGTYESSEVFVNRVMLERAREVWIAADHSRFGQILPALICRAGQVRRIITDTGATDAMTAPLEALGVEVIRV